MSPTLWPDVSFHVVSGKGGTGKTTVAGALAMALARDGRRTLLMEVEGRQGIAQLFDVPPLPYEERKVAVAPGEARSGLSPWIPKTHSWITSRSSTTSGAQDPLFAAWVLSISPRQSHPVCVMFS